MTIDIGFSKIRDFEYVIGKKAAAYFKNHIKNGD